MKTLITGGLVIDPAQKLDENREVFVENGKIAGMFAPKKVPQALLTKDVKVIDVRGCWITPGLIDMHVHLREPGRESDETIATGTKAAAQGGVTTVLAMPNTEPVIDSPALVHFLRERSKAQGVVNVVVAGAVTRGQKGLELAEMGKMAEAGAVAMSDDGHPVMNALIMRRALEYAKGFDLPILDHCEESNLAAGGVMNEGCCSAAKGVHGIPSTSETVMAMRDISLAELTGGRLHICHVSCAETVDLVRKAKKRGVRVTAEAAPHHFTLTDGDIPEYDADFKMNPPLRSKKDVEAIREGLSDGTIDAIATDHAPHSPSKKAMGLVAAPFGVIGLETVLPLSLTLVIRKVLTRMSLIERLSTKPAKILGLHSKGSLKKGCDADITIIDPKAKYTLAPQGESKSRNTPFKGWELQGRAVTAIVGGRVVMDRGQIQSWV